MNARWLACVWIGLCVAACTPKDPIAIRNAWIRAPAPGLQVAAGYLDIENTGAGALALIGASSTAAGSIEIHSETHDGDMMQMRQLDAVAIPRGQTVSLAPGGTHLMLLQFTGASPTIPVTLTFDNGERRDVAFELRALDGGRP